MAIFTTLADIDLDPRIILAIGFLVFSGLKWLFGKVGSQGQAKHESDLEDIYEQYREEIRRKQTSNPTAPPQVIQQPAQTPPPLPIQHKSAQVSKPTTVESLTRSYRKQEPKLSKAEQEALEKIQSSGNLLRSKRRKKARHGKTSYTKLLSTPDSARQAIVLSEVLGPPKAMR
ncbi:hypothetical protein SAMN02745181_1761 [Rubritalea squalenifaciens DSM 18772]|uniref:Uncharacterized protein n=1 Tax=Rubritalea squalenifaciens DSM 18772 TaxID=1123071 RepID=A0A1M6ICV2_9BACT|nr:hypothetical protein [Rubritalea squalenifaciens]SHJ32237.1 hypothetical protein SAMN02745181_1761 [Rubritalea squalenifaciens DSM 18772]